MALSILNYGATRTGKTYQAKFIADYVWKKYRKKTRFITTDTGSLWEPIQSRVDAGIVKPLFVPTDPSYNSIAIFRKLRRGEWLKNYDPSGFCLKPNGKNDWVPWDRQEEAKEIGAYVFESLSTIGTGTMRDLAEKNVTVGDKSVPGLRTEDGETFANNTENHYGMILSEIPEFLNALTAMPVEVVYVTALDEVIEPKDTEFVKVYKLGPQLPGRKLINVVPSRVNMCLHSMVVPGAAGNELRCYLKPHPWSVLNKYQWPAGLRMEGADADKKWPDGFITLTREKGIGEILEFRDKVREDAKQAALKEMAQA